MFERSERSERSEFCGRASRPSTAGDEARRASHEPQLKRSTPPARGFAPARTVVKDHRDVTGYSPRGRHNNTATISAMFENSATFGARNPV